MHQNHRYTDQQPTAIQKPHSIAYTSNNTPIQIQNLYGSEALPSYRNRIYTSPNNSHAIQNHQQIASYATNNYYHAEQAASSHAHYAVNHTVVLPPGLIAHTDSSYQHTGHRQNQALERSRLNNRQSEYLNGRRYHTSDIGNKQDKQFYDIHGKRVNFRDTRISLPQYQQNLAQRHQIQNSNNTQFMQGYHTEHSSNHQNNVFIQRVHSPQVQARQMNRQNYHMAGIIPNLNSQNAAMNQHHEVNRRSPIKVSSPVAEHESRKSEIKRLSPAFQYNPETAMKINFRYNSQNVIYQPQPIPVVYQPPPQQIVTHHQTHTVTTTVTVWQHHFVEIYMRFQSFVERFESIIEQFLIIQDLFDNVSDEEGWTELRTRYNGLMEKFASIRQQSIMVIQNNREVVEKLSEETLQYYRQKEEGESYHENIQQQKPQSGAGSSGNQQIQPQPEPVQENEEGDYEQINWQQRYYEAAEGYEALKQQYQALYAQLENVSKILEQQQQQQNQQGDKQVINRNSQLEKNYNIMQNQYQNLQENFHKISVDYNEAIKEIQNFEQVEQQYQQQIMRLQQNSKEMPEQQEIQNMVNQYEQQLQAAGQQLQAAGQRIDYLQQQLNNRQEHRNQNAQVEHNAAYQNRIEQLLEQKNHMINTINQMHEELQHNQHQIQQLQNNQQQQNNMNFQQFQQQIMQYQQDVQQKERFIQQMSSSYQNLQLQIEQMERINNNNSEKEELINEIEGLKSKITILEKTIEFKTTEINENQTRMNSLKDEYLAKMEEYRRKEKQFHKKQLENSRTLSLQEQSKMNEKIQELQRELLEKTMELQNIQQETKIIINETRNSNTKKITILQEEITEYKESIQKVRKDRQKAINKIKEYFYEETSGYDKKISQKDDMIRLLNQKVRAFQKELASRNMEISRFRYQNNHASIGTNANNDELKKVNEVLQRKNAELQQTKKSLQQKILTIKELEQKIHSLEQQVSDKVFQNNNLKREVFEIHNCKAEIQSLNTNLKKKNQQISELRLSTLENDQLKVVIDSLERQKIRHAEYLKERDREISAKNSKISQMEKKINTLLLEQGKLSTNSSPSNQIHSSFSANYENILKQKESENKKLQYEIQVQTISLQSKQKNIRDLNEKISSLQQSYSLLKAQSENKYVKLQGNSKDYQKRCYELENQKNELTNAKELLQHKIRSLEKSQQDGMKLFDKQIKGSKNKLLAMQQKYTQLTTQYQLHKNSTKIIEQENLQLKNKLESLQKKIDEKNDSIESLKMTTLQDNQDYQKQLEKNRKQLESKLQQEKIRSRSLEENIKKLENKLKEVQLERRSYKQKLYTEYSHSQQFAENRFYTEQASDFNKPHHTRISQGMDKFKLKDAEANDVFQRKVIYDLKRENDLLRRELSGLGGSSFSLNRFEGVNQQQSIYQQITDRGPLRASEPVPVQDPALEFHKQKNKELEIRIEQLLAMNKSLKDKLSGYGSSSQLPQETIQFYKSEIQSLELLNKNLSNKHNALINQNYTLKQEQLEYQTQIKNLKAKIAQLQNQIRESKGKNKESQNLQREIDNLKNMLNQQKKQAKNLYTKYKNKQQELGAELAKEKSKNSTLSSELERLKQLLKLNEESHTSKIETSESELEDLRNTIRQLTMKIRLLEQQLLNKGNDNNNIEDLRFTIQKLRSIYLAIESLVSEIGVLKSEESRDGTIIMSIRSNINEALNLMEAIEL